jgi:hypothetical protein
MKLNEVLTKEIPNLPQSEKKLLDRGNQPLNTKGKWTLLGGGQQARAYNSYPKNNVVKLANITGPDDPVYQFLRVCLKHQDNPYFPKIYNVKKYKLNTDRSTKVINKYKLVITMERLRHVTLADTKLLERLFGLSFKKFQDDRTAGKFLRSMFYDQGWRQELIKNTKDVKLKQALKLVEPLFRHYQGDMHLGNIMLRGTGSGAQLVIIDPVF